MGEISDKEERQDGKKLVEGMCVCLCVGGG